MIVKMESEKAKDVEFNGQNRCYKFVRASDSTDTQSTSSNDRPSTDLLENWTNQKAYTAMAEERSSELPYVMKRLLVNS